MKQLLSLLLVALSALCISCDALHTAASNKINSQGSPYELIVVCNQPEWESPLGDSLRGMFKDDIPYLAQIEPYFDMFRVTQQGYDKLVVRHRNIFIVNIVSTITEPSIIVQYDVNASPQIIMTLQAPNVASATEYLAANRANVMQVLEKAERDRSIEYAEKHSVQSLNDLIKLKFDITMRVPDGFTLRNEKDDFLWISYEYPKASQGFMIYSYPAQGNSSLTSEALLKARNKYAALIPGPSDNSYMTTFMEAAPDYRLFRIEGRLWAEMRGFWEVEGDFMGGPYVSYSTIDTRTNEIVTIDCYVFSPDLGKRNFMRTLEHLIYGVEIPVE